MHFQPGTYTLQSNIESLSEFVQEVPDYQVGYTTGYIFDNWTQKQQLSEIFRRWWNKRNVNRKINPHNIQAMRIFLQGRQKAVTTIANGNGCQNRNGESQ